jgi:DNA gyrase/topoisomerase IV subunit A
MNDKIIKVDAHEQYMSNMARYSIYVLYSRYVPDIRDGLKPVQRRILYAMWNDIGCTTIGTKRKSANTVGTVIAKYHSHGDTSVYDAMKPMTNWWEIKIPLINYDSNSGSLQGGPQAAARYTESYMSKFAVECVIGDLAESKQLVDWQNTFDNHTIEPEVLPVKVPLLLVNGTFAIAIGRRIEVPKHSLNDVIDATLAVLHDPKAKVVLIPDPCQKCEIVDTDWKKISNLGYGYFVERGIIEIGTLKNGNQFLSIKSVPDLVTANSIMEKVEDLIKNNILIQISDIQDHSTEDGLDIRLILKKGADANYVKQTLYKNTSLQDTKRVNMQVINGTEICNISYKAYISYFLEFRKETKFRLYNAKLQKAETRLHQIETYIKILESGDVENIIHMIRNQSSMDEGYLVNWLMKKLKITDLQAKFVLHTEIGRLSKGHLNKYKAEQTKLNKEVESYIQMITNENLINQEIEAELLDIKARYGQPRKSIIISEAEASDIPEGEFKVILTEQNYLKKMAIEEPIKVIKGDNPKCITIADNSKDILLFDQMGKVFRLPVNKISFTDKNSVGIDIRMLIKKATSNIISVMYEPIVDMLNNKQSKYFIVTVTKGGLIKRMDLADILTATPSGIIYSKLNSGDEICDILIANQKSDIIVYTKSKALRFSINEIPYLKRATLGNVAMKTNDYVDGISVITSETKELIVVTAKGKFNKLNPSVLPSSSRNRAGNRVIKLTKGDYIKNIFACNGNVSIKITRPDEILEISTESIPMGSSISSGVKLCKEGIIKAELIKK